jgi:hypothetical protein
MRELQGGSEQIVICCSPSADSYVTVAPNAPDREAMMRAGLATAIVAAFTVAASIVGGGVAVAACRTGAKVDCVDLDLVPQISQQIVATEHIVVPPKEAPAAEPRPAYTGPIVGAAKNVRRAPTIGYRWSIE